MAEKNQRPTLFAASGLYLLAALGLWIAALPVSTWIGSMAGLSAETRTLLVNLAYYLPFLMLPAALLAKRKGGAALRINPIAPGAMVCAIILALLTLSVVQNFYMLWIIPWQKLGFDVFASEYVRPANRMELTLSVISGAILAPVGEELLFRGAMLSAWERRGTKQAVVVTAVLFAVMHGSLLGLPGELFGGMMLGLLVVWTDSLYAGLAFHTTYNAGALIMNYLSSSMAVDAAEEALMHSDVLAYIGGWPMVLVLAVDILLTLLFMGLFIRPLRVTYAFRCMLRCMAEHPDAAKEGLRLGRGKLFFNQPEQPEGMSLGAKLLLGLGFLSALGVYAMDILSMLGG